MDVIRNDLVGLFDNCNESSPLLPGLKRIPFQVVKHFGDAN